MIHWIPQVLATVNDDHYIFYDQSVKANIQWIHPEDTNSGGKAGYRILKEQPALLTKMWATFPSLIPSCMVPFVDPIPLRLKHMRKWEQIQLPAREIAKTPSFHQNDHLSTQLPRDIQKLICSFLTVPELATLSVVSLYWNVLSAEMRRKEVVKFLFPEFLLKAIGLETLLKIPQMSVKAHRAGQLESNSCLIQESRSSNLAEYVDFLTPMDMKKHPVAWFVDPWGRLGIAIAYIFNEMDGTKKEKVLVLQQRGVKKEDSWIAVEHSEKSNTRSDESLWIFSTVKEFFPSRWENNLHSLGYLKRLIAGEACGACQILKDHNIVEGPAYLDAAKTIPVVMRCPAPAPKTELRPSSDI